MNVNKQGIEQLKSFKNKIAHAISTKVPFLMKLQRKFKTFNIFRVVQRDLEIYFEFKRVDFTGFKEFYGLDNITNRIVGFLPRYVGFRPSKLIYKNNILNKLLIENIDSLNEDLRGCLNNSFLNFKQVISGSPDSNSLHLREFLKPDKNLRTVEELIDIVSLAKQWFLIPELDFNNKHEMAYCTNYNPQSWPGFITNIFLSSRQKGCTINFSLSISMYLFDLIRKIPIRNMSLWDIFAREKECKLELGVSFKELGTRVVVVTEEYVAHLCGWVFQKIMKCVPSRFDDKLKYHINGEYNGYKANKIYNKIHEYDYVLDADWSKFDSTIDSQYLIVACLILFTPSIRTKQDMRFFYFILSSVVTKNIIIPPGIVVEVNRGNPSGHPCVTAVNCIVNLIRWAVIGKQIYGDDFMKYMDIEVYGDDALVLFKDNVNLKNLDYIADKEGYQFDPLYDKLFPSYFFFSEDYTTPDFLKRRFTPKGLFWNPNKIFDKLIYQSRERTIAEQFALVINYINTAPCDDDMNEFLFKLLRGIIRDYKDSLSSFDIDTYQTLINNKQLTTKFIPRNKIDMKDGIDFYHEFTSSSIEIYKPNAKIKNEFTKIDPFLFEAICVHSISPYYFNWVIKNEKRNIIPIFPMLPYQFDIELYKTILFRQHNVRPP